MNIKLLLYCIFIPFCIWIITSTNMSKIFRKNNVMQIHCFYLFISLGLSYLIVNFIMDIYSTISILYEGE